MNFVKLVAAFAAGVFVGVNLFSLIKLAVLAIVVAVAYVVVSAVVAVALPEKEETI